MGIMLKAACTAMIRTWLGNGWPLDVEDKDVDYSWFGGLTVYTSAPYNELNPFGSNRSGHQHVVLTTVFILLNGVEE